MELDVGGREGNVEVVAAGEDGIIDPTRLSNHSATAALLDQQLVNSQEILVPTTEVQVETQALTSQGLDPSLAMVAMAGQQQASIITIPVEPASPSRQKTLLVGAKRSLQESLVSDHPVSLLESVVNPQGGSDIPRKKSRNYLDSHKTIEKKRRDRINTCLENLKSLVPDCQQYGSKKLDKAEILEMSIAYIKKIQPQGAGRTSANLDLALNQREWANDLTTWVIHNKLLYSGSNSLDQFCQALLLHLQSMGSGNALASATSMLLNQANVSNEEDALLRQQTVTAQAAILQQLQQQQQQQQGSSPKESGASGQQQNAQQQLQQAQLTQLQALLLLQQQQQLLSQQQQQESDAQAQQTHLQQLQQLQQLQALLLQHIANEASSTSAVLNGSGSEGKMSEQGESTGSGSQVHQPPSASDGENLPVNSSAVLTSANPMTSEAAPSSGGEELTPQTEDLGAPVTTEETVYTSAIADTLDENLLSVGVNQTDTQTEISDPTGQMWSAAGSGRHSQSTSLLLLGGGSESEGEGPPIVEKSSSQLLETGIDGEVQEEVELMAQQEQ